MFAGGEERRRVIRASLWRGVDSIMVYRGALMNILCMAMNWLKNLTSTSALLVEQNGDHKTMDVDDTVVVLGQPSDVRYVIIHWNVAVIL